ncbi:uncharacterized protein LOC122195409 [Lactuca sativa]|uniref:uncharacterized protein LOC122195409 n=1 Tax=Lactuca sativa TaxID=4236 RepID=UPI001C68EF2A|nr:uncharacterized protein LOC122195409 [Lactuca sativa]
MLSFVNLTLYFWANVVATACFTQNRSYINKRFLIAPYVIINNQKPNVKLFHVFGSKYFLFNSKGNRNKFDEKTNEGIFLGYSLTLKAYRVLNKRSKKIEESYYVTFDDKYMKKYQKEDCQSEEIFPSANSTTIPLMNLYEEVLNFFDETEKAISS